LRWNYDDLKDRVTATELGVARALVAALGGKIPGEMPGFDEVVRKEQHQQRIPTWMQEFEKVNVGRVIQTG